MAWYKDFWYEKGHRDVQRLGKFLKAAQPAQNVSKAESESVAEAAGALAKELIAQGAAIVPTICILIG